MNNRLNLNVARLCALALLLSVMCGVIPLANAQNETNAIRKVEVEKPVLRDPFWPVGYEPKDETDSVVVEKPPEDKPVVYDWEKAEKNLQISGVSKRDDVYVTVINGRVLSVGNKFRVRVGPVAYTWEIESISLPKSVSLRRVSAQTDI